MSRGRRCRVAWPGPPALSIAGTILMKPTLAWLQITLLLLLAALSCVGDGGAPLGATQQSFTQEMPPPSPRPFELPERPIVRGAEAGYQPRSARMSCPTGRTPLRCRLTSCRGRHPAGCLPSRLVAAL